ncbi:MAG: 4-fold beta flower protein [Agriterribacter sp.]
MHPLLDIAGNPAGFIYQNAILHPISLNVFGVILGHCVFGLKGTVIGKFFDHHLYDKLGKIVAVTGSNELSERAALVDQAKAIQQAWQIIGRIEDHAAPWVQPLPAWSDKTLQDVLANN